MVKEEYVSTFGLLQVWGNYLYMYGYNTAEELVNMPYNEMEERYNEVTKGDDKE